MKKIARIVSLLLVKNMAAKTAAGLAVASNIDSYWGARAGGRAGAGRSVAQRPEPAHSGAPPGLEQAHRPPAARRPQHNTEASGRGREGAPGGGSESTRGPRVQKRPHRLERGLAVRGCGQGCSRGPGPGAPALGPTQERRRGAAHTHARARRQVRCAASPSGRNGKQVGGGRAPAPQRPSHSSGLTPGGAAGLS